MVQNLENEIWKEVDGRGGAYLISNCGRVKSTKRDVKAPFGGVRTVDEIILKPMKNIDGYPVANLNTGGPFKQVKIHRLMAIAFIPNPENKPVVNHINGVKDDNRLENLEWASVKENSQHAAKMGKMSFTAERKKHIGELLRGGRSYRAKLVLNTQTGIFYDTIGDAAESAGMKRFTLNSKFLGRKKNNTPFILA